MSLSIADIMAPLDWATFARDYKGRRPLHLKGTPDKFAAVMSWPLLSELLSQTSIWSPRTLALQLDAGAVDPRDYCTPGTTRDQREGLLPDMDKVAAWLRRGASLVLNDIGDLAPGLKAATAALEAAGHGKVQANLYCSWQAHPAFATHFDTHDVYAFHIAGTKTWQIYGRAFEDPIAHPRFKNLSREHHEAQRGPVTMTAKLEPGDLLYIPRGWYHDALADSAATIHIAFGLTTLIGLALLEPLFERAVADPLFRATVPEGEALAGHLASLGDRLAALTRDPGFVAETRAALAGYRYPHGTITLPDDALQPRYRRRGERLRVVRQGREHLLHDGSRTVPIPAGFEGPVAWILERPEFTEAALAEAFPLLSAAARPELIRALLAMRVIEKM